MKGDFSRFTFRRDRHYSGVRMQQGRVQLDADWNEQVDILAHLRHTEARDVIGATGVPHERGGFLITPSGGNFTISDGRIYVDGALVENDKVVWFKPASGEGSTTPVQPHYPLNETWAPESTGLYIVYLDIWERHITALEDLAIREVALGGPDTGTRNQVIWQARLLRVGDAGSTLTCWDTATQWTALITPPVGRLSARTAVAEASPNPCMVPAAAGYRGLENQLYRVEIHDRGALGSATFKWSRDNGMVVTRLLELDGKMLSVADVGRDEVLGFAPGQWIEISDDTRVLHQEPGVLVKIANIVENNIEISAWPGSVTSGDFDLDTATVRRWDHVSDIDPVTDTAIGAVKVVVDKWIDLESGVQIKFDGDGEYETGDYWRIPARTVSTNQLGGDIEWPREPDPIDSNVQRPVWLEPNGIKHSYAQLALVVWDGTNYELKHDCRPLFSALTDPDLYYVSGDGQEAMPGECLPQPLRVGVVNCNRPCEGAWVKLEIIAGNGTLELEAIPDGYQVLGGTTTAITAFLGRTDSQGELRTLWRLEELTDKQNVPDQLVRATLLREGTDVPDNYLDRPVLFGASFGVAWQNQFGGSDFPDQQHPSLKVETVEGALDQLRENTALHYVSGDGQEAMPGDMLPQLLQVRVANGQWPRQDAQVLFTTQQGTLQSGAISGQSVTVRTDTDGLARCAWTLDSAGPASQQVKAVLVSPSQFSGSADLSVPGLVYFNGSLSIAEEIAYTPPKDEIYSESPPENVKEALDELYHAKVNRAGDTMTGDLIINANLAVDGNCVIEGNLTVNGTNTTVNTETLEVEDNIIRVNKYQPQAVPLVTNGGLEVFRGGTEFNAQVLWDETADHWKMGLEGALYDVAYGPDWVTLTQKHIADALHRHSLLYASDTAPTPALSVNPVDNIGIGTTNPNARLHVVPPPRDTAKVPWKGLGSAVAKRSGSSQQWETQDLLSISAKNDTFPKIIYNATGLLITDQGGKATAQVSGEGTLAYLYMFIQDAHSLEWTAVKYWPLSPTVKFIPSVQKFDQEKSAQFAKCNVSGIKFAVALSPNTTIEISGWEGMQFEFYSDHDAAIFEGHVGIGTRNPLTALDVKGTVQVDGALTSTMWQATQPINMLPGPLQKLPKSNFNSGGGTLLVFASGSGWSAAVASQIGMEILIDDTVRGEARSFTNEIGSHKVFSANALLAVGIPAGSHSLMLRALANTSTDLNDFFSVTVLELPWA